jgi:hypothetical protein
MVYTPLDRSARPTAVEQIASALIHGPNTLAVVGFVEDSDWESASQIRLGCAWVPSPS